MDKILQKYILMQDRVGEHAEKGWIMTKTVPTQLIRGEIFEALPESEQPESDVKIALKVLSIVNQNIKLECHTLDVSKLTDSEANLLVAVSSLEERFRIYRGRNRLAPGESLVVGTQVLVKVKDYPKELSGVIWYKGNVTTHIGTMFGVELLGKEAEGRGTTDGTFRNKKYFECPQDRGVFVALDKLCLQQDPAKSPKKEATGKPILSTIKDMVMPSSSSKDLHSKKIAKDHKLKIDQRVVVCLDNISPRRGTVRYISETTRSDGDLPIGIELDDRKGGGTGIFRGKQRFVCKKDYAVFVPVTSVIPEEDFDDLNPVNTKPSHDRLTQSGGSFGYYETNFSKPENSGIKRSSSATSMSSKISEEALDIAGGNLPNQHIIFSEIQAKRKVENNATDMKTEPVPTSQYMGRFMDFDEEHFKRSPLMNSETPQTSVHPSSQEETVHGSSGLPYLRSSLPESHLNNISQEVYSNKNFPYNTNSKNRGHHPPSEFHVEGKVTSTGGVIQHSFMFDTPIDTPMRDLQNKVQTPAEDKIPYNLNIPPGLELESMVEVPFMGGQKTQYGVIKWIGQLPEQPGKIVAGLELETEQAKAACSDGMFGGRRYFTCPAGRAFFVNLQNCRRDSRFQSEYPGATKLSGKVFGSIETPVVPGIVPPPFSLTEHHQGRMKGIQGHHNSCYLDATLFSMFAFTTVFDSLLHRSKNEDDLEQYTSVQDVLKEQIVNPLRDTGFVRADRVLQLRSLLNELGSTSGLMNEEKDPEEFLNTLLHQVLKSEPLLKLKTPNSRGEESNYYQIITEKDDTKKSQPVQKLLEQSFLFSDLKLAEVPSCLILQMPRFGKRYKMYDFIQPNLKLDVTHILENVPRACSVCGAVSTFECKDCYPEKHDLSSLGYCKTCVKTFHNHHLRTGHKPTPIMVPREYSRYLKELGNAPIEKQTMDLFAVVCIATSHYVAFVKCGTSEDAPWCFFDSMADRKGETNGYNIPVVSPCPEAKAWLTKKDEDIVRASENGKLPPDMKRLFGDAYMCLYQNLEMTMYK